MSLLGKLKDLGSAIKDAPEETVQLGSRIVKNISTEANTPGSSGQKFMDAPLLGLTYALPKPVQTAANFVAPSPRKVIRDTTSFMRNPSAGNSLAFGGDVLSVASLPTLVAAPARLLSGETKLGASIAKAPLKFPDSNPERSMVGRIKNVLNDKMAADRAAASFTAQRNAELPGKIAAVKQEITRIDSLGNRAAQAAGGKTGNISRITQKLKGGEEGSLQIPNSKRVAAAHRAVPKDQMLTTFETTPVGPKSMSLRISKGAGTNPAEEAGALDLMKRAQQDVASRRSQVAGFYEKLNSEKGWIRMQKAGPHTTDIHFGEGVFAKVPQTVAGQTVLGKDITVPANHYRLTVGNAGKANALSVDWFKRTGNPGNVQKELQALGKNLKARGINKVTFEPLLSTKASGHLARASGSNARERLFTGMANKLGLKAESKGGANILRDIPAPTALPGTGGSDTGTSRIAVALRQMRSERGSLTLGSADKESALTKRFGVKPTKGELKSRAYAGRNYGFGESARPEMKTIMGKHLSILDALKTHPARLSKN